MKNQTNISMSSWWGNDNTRERQRQRGKNNNNHKEKNKDHLKQNKLEHRVTQPMQRCCVRGYHRLGREQDKTANSRYWDYVRLSMGLISAPQTMHPEDAYSLGVFWRSAWPDTHSRTAPRSRYVYTSRHDPYSSLSSPLESKYHNQNRPTRSPALVGTLKESGA